MIPTTTITSVKNADKALFFMTKKGCSNCEKVKPMIEKFETENPDVLVFTHEAESPNDEMLKEFPPIKMFPWIFCLKSGKLVSVTNAIPPYDSFAIGLLPLVDKYANFGKVTRQIAQMEQELKNAKEFHQFLDQSIAMEETEKEPDFLPTETATTQPVEPCESCT